MGPVSAAEHPHAYVRRMVVNQHVGWRRRRASGEVAVPPEAMPEVTTADLAGDLVAPDATWRMLAQLPANSGQSWSSADEGVDYDGARSGAEAATNPVTG